MQRSTYDVVTENPEQVARARRAPDQEAVLERVGFRLAGFARSRLDGAEVHPDLKDVVHAVWVDPSGTVLAQVERLYGHGVVELWSVSEDGHVQRSIWFDTPGMPWGSWLSAPPAEGEPPWSIRTALMGQGTEEVVRLFHDPGCRLHVADRSGEPLDSAVEAHLAGRGSLTDSGWLALSLGDEWFLARRMEVIALDPERVVAKMSWAMVPLTVGVPVASLVATIAVVAVLMDNPTHAAARESDLAAVFGATLSGLIGWLLGTLFWLHGRAGGALAFAATAPVVLASGLLLVWLTPRDALPLAGLWVLAGVLVGMGFAAFERVLSKAVAPARWDGLTGVEILDQAGPAQNAPQAIVEPQVPFPALAEAGWTCTDRVKWGSRERSHGMFDALRLVADAPSERGVVWADVWRAPTGIAVAFVVLLDGEPWVSMVSRLRDGTLLETRSLPDPGVWNVLADSDVLTAPGYAWSRVCPSEARYLLSSRLSTQLEVDHVGAWGDVLAARMVTRDPVPVEEDLTDLRSDLGRRRPPMSGLHVLHPADLAVFVLAGFAPRMGWGDVFGGHTEAVMIGVLAGWFYGSWRQVRSNGLLWVAAVLWVVALVLEGGVPLGGVAWFFGGMASVHLVRALVVKVQMARLASGAL